MLDPLPDPEMEGLSAKTAEPVILEANIGQLVLDRTFPTFEGKADDLGVKVSMWYKGPELLLAGQGNMAKKFKSALNFINNVLSQEYLDNARMLGPKKRFRPRTGGATMWPRRKGGRHPPRNSGWRASTPS